MEEAKKKKPRNYAFAEGYLRETYLSEATTKQGIPCIKGDVVVSISRFNSQRIHVFAQEKKSDGTENKAYKSLKTLLGDKVATIASFLSTLPQESDIESLDEGVWDAAIKVASKVWFSGSLEEYATISTDEKGMERETSSFSFRAGNGSVRRETGEQHPFNPRCNVELDGSILAIREEQKRGEDGEMEETGRVVIDYLYIDYKGVGHKFKIVAPNTPVNPANADMGTIADYIKDNYEVGQTGLFNVTILNLVEKKEGASKGAVGWGQVAQPATTTSFVHELLLFGGRSMKGLDEESAGYITKEEVTAASTARRVTAKENYERSQTRKSGGSYIKKPEPQKGFGASVFGDAMDMPGFEDF